VFKNIRFAAPPTENLRWEKPAHPLVQTGIQDGSYGFACTQSLSSGLCFLCRLYPLEINQKVKLSMRLIHLKV
jgi:hypothetical protein